MASGSPEIAGETLERAASALGAYITKVREQQNEDELLGAREDFVWLVVSTKRMSPEKKLKPYRIPLTHPIVDPRTNSVCLLVKDPQREYKDLLEAKDVKFISRVVGVSKLKGKFKPFEARRQLLNDHGLFLADERIVPMLPTLLGTMFFQAKKQPIPVNVTKPNVKAELEKAISATYLHQNQGTCTSVKIASSTHSVSQIVQNLQTAIPAIVSKIPDGWGNIQSLHIKTSLSASLPIWTCDLASGARWSLAEPAPVVVAADAKGKGKAPSGKRQRDEDAEDSSSAPVPRRKSAMTSSSRPTTALSKTPDPAPRKSSKVKSATKSGVSSSTKIRRQLVT